ncbi:MAG: alpha/beta hydrolase [Ruminococcaceae bacterium]|nr:alpha/beta hydrolase [Oscillospiraceae bacterium]
MKKTVRNILIGSGAFALTVAAVSALSYNITKKLVKVALDREEPKATKKSQEKLVGSETFFKNIEEMGPSVEKLKNSSLEVIEIEASDGERLVGHFYRCENAKRTIVAMHGWRSSWAGDFGAISDFWHNNGCNVLYAEQRGQGDSGGKYMGFGLIERFDCLDWVNFLNKMGLDTLPIYLCGVSMGASTVLMAASLNLSENVKGIIADCGFTSAHDIWKHVSENNLGIPYTTVISSIVDDMFKKKIQMGAKDYSSVDAMKESRVPVMFVHGTDDHFVPIEMTYENYKACTSPKRLFVVPGAEHGMSYLEDKEGYEAEVLKFFEDYDK